MRLLLNGVQGFNPDEFRLSSVSLSLILRRFQGRLYAQEITVPLFLAHQINADDCRKSGAVRSVVHF
jgi:hypothetical protein